MSGLGAVNIRLTAVSIRLTAVSNRLRELVEVLQAVRMHRLQLYIDFDMLHCMCIQMTCSHANALLPTTIGRMLDHF